MASGSFFRLDDAGVRQLLEGQDGPIGRDLLRRGLRVQNRAKDLAPVDEGRLRADTRAELGRDAKGLVCRIGTTVEYALPVHEGSRPHWPPPGALDRWARMHGMSSGFLVARAISRRGTKARPFLRDALPAAD